MTVEVRPLGVKCNIQCQYCYQNPQRDADSVIHRYDLDQMISALEEYGSPFSLFGGEPLLVPLDDLEIIWRWGFERFGRNSLQTNGSLLTDKHFELIERYNVQVGISIDGPADLNDVRWAGSLEKTRSATAKTEAALMRLCENGRPPSLIITLHRGNAAEERLDRLVSWIDQLDSLGVRSVRLHLLEAESDSIRETYALSPEDNIEALARIEERSQGFKQLRISLFSDIERLLRGDDRRVSCVWKNCDPYTTQAVQGIEGNGQRSNCGRTNKDGIDFVKADKAGFERYLALYYTPREFGGCAGCRFFLMCKGQCPGTAIEGDWRNRTEHCEVWMHLFERSERALVGRRQWVLSRSRLRREVEKRVIEAWIEGRSPRLYEVVAAARLDARNGN